MHPSLDLSNLRKLPPTLKKRANAAATGSFGEIISLTRELRDMPAQSRRFLLPVYWATLSTSDLDTFRQQESAEGQTEYLARICRKLSRNFAAFDGIRLLAEAHMVPPSAWHDLWPRIWAWMEVLHPLTEDLFHQGTLGVADLSVEYLSSVALLWCAKESCNGDLASEALLTGTPGLWVIIGMAWKHLLGANDDRGITAVARLQDFYTVGDGLNISLVRDLAEGAGGTWEDFATVTIMHWDYGLRRNENRHLYTVVSILRNVFFSEVPLRDALLTQSFVSVLCRTSLHLAAHPEVRDPEGKRIHLPDAVFGFMVFGLLYDNARRYMLEALRAGFLRVLFAYAHLCVEGQQSGELVETVLDEVLPPSTVFRSVLRQLGISLPEVRARDAAVHFQSENLLGYWTAFVDLVDERLQLLDKHSAGALKILRACDNLKCGRIREKRELRRCSRCLLAYYCSNACQTVDYRGGGHRADCLHLRMAHQDYISEYRAKDRAFFRVLLNHEYMTQREEIAMELLGFLHTHSGSAALPQVCFNFQYGFCEVSVISAKEDTDASLNPKSCYYACMKARAARSGGRMQLHVSCLNSRGVGENPEAVDNLMPLRCANGDVYGGLRRIAESIPEPREGVVVDLEPYRATVQRLLALNEQVAWTH